MSSSHTPLWRGYMRYDEEQTNDYLIIIMWYNFLWFTWLLWPFVFFISSIVCPSGFIKIVGSVSCYKFVTKTVTWDIARQGCQRLGTHLVSIESAAEEAALVAYILASEWLVFSPQSLGQILDQWLHQQLCIGKTRWRCCYLCGRFEFSSFYHTF